MIHYRKAFLAGYEEAMQMVRNAIDKLGYWIPHCDNCTNQKFCVKVEELKKELFGDVDSTPKMVKHLEDCKFNHPLNDGVCHVKMCCCNCKQCEKFEVKI